MRLLATLLLLLLPAADAAAHASDQGFVLLLPTKLYIAGGVATVAATVLLVALLPGRAAMGLFRPLALWRSRRWPGAGAASLASFAALCVLVLAGLTGSQDPTRNPLPLAVWSLWWVALVFLQGVLGDIWRWLNPWTGPLMLARRVLRPRLRLPSALGHWPAVLTFLAFSAVLLAHPAPADPDRLAVMVASYWALHFAAAVLFGRRWLVRAEGLTLLFTVYARLAMLSRAGGRLRLGLPGWQYLRRRPPPCGVAVFMLVMLAVGSFDGLNETFWWLARIGVNPLEFPGRSAIVWQSLSGLAIACAGLVPVFALSTWLGLRLMPGAPPIGIAFRVLAPSILPIALGYHFAHYLPTFLVEIQYVVRAVSDQLGLGHVHVTTGFFNTLATVRLIWLSQAGAVVAGHVVAILLGHALAVRLLGSTRHATLSQVPLAVFMVAYTLFGLWLLASPRGA